MTDRSIEAVDGPDGGKVVTIQQGAPETGMLTILRLTREEVLRLRAQLTPTVKPSMAPPPLPPLGDTWDRAFDFVRATYPGDPGSPPKETP